MCMTLHASEMKITKGYAGEALRDGAYVHVLAYQNEATNLGDGPNAMLLPVPADGEIGPENFFDTRKFKGFLGDIAQATRGTTRFRGFGKGHDSDDRLGGKVFEVGSYTIVVATKASQVQEALRKVPRNKRPEINQEVIDSFAVNYPGWPLLVCCWDGAIEAEPILLWYTPKAPSLLFFPALDAHDGHAPQPGPVPVDHFVTFGSTLTPLGYDEIYYKDAIPSGPREILPTRAVGNPVKGRAPNGDFWYLTKNFQARDEKTKYDPIPPAWRAWPGATSERVVVKLGTWA